VHTPKVNERIDKSIDLRDVLELDTARTDFGPFGGGFQAFQPTVPVVTGISPLGTTDKFDDFHWLLKITRMITGQGF
jgi:hypothetical protein